MEQGPPAEERTLRHSGLDGSIAADRELDVSVVGFQGEILRSTSLVREAAVTLLDRDVDREVVMAANDIASDVSVLHAEGEGGADVDVVHDDVATIGREAGVYGDGTTTRLFALCLEHGEAEGLMRIPAGSYLCAQCMEEERVATKERLMALAQSEYGAKPSFCLEIIVVAGILNWDYEVQIPIEGGA